MKPVIGFTNKYYTLWEVSNPYRVTHSTYIETKVDTVYLQNLSFSKEEALRKAKERYGVDVVIDEELRGVCARSFSTTISRENNPSVFLFGKYVGSSFTEIDDVSYKLWYWSQTKDTHQFSQEIEDELVKMELIIPFMGDIIAVTELEGRVDGMLRKLESDLFPHGHWGTNGEKVVLEGEVIGTGSINSYYGTMYTYQIGAKEVSYLATGSSELDMKVGDKVRLSGTLKHVKYWSDWHGVEVVRTELKRVKVLGKYK
jgi:hypothetical protein